jgi:hypothetical protein
MWRLRIPPKAIILIGLLTFVFTAPVFAQEALKKYLSQMDATYGSCLRNYPLAIECELQAVSRQNSLLALRKLLEKHTSLWVGVRIKLSSVEPPREAQKHFDSALRHVNAQFALSQFRLKNVNQRIALVRNYQQMPKDGASEKELKIYVAENSPSEEEVAKKFAELTNAIQGFEAEVAAERKSVEAKLR